MVENSTDDESQHYSDTLDSTSKVVTDENEDDDGKDDENGDEDNNNKDDDNGDEDDDQLSNEIVMFWNPSKEIKIIIKKLSQLLQESKRGAKQNRRTLIILLDLLEDCGTIEDNDYEKLYDAIVNICNKYWL